MIVTMMNKPKTYCFRINCKSFIPCQYSWDYRHERDGASPLPNNVKWRTQPMLF